MIRYELRCASEHAFEGWFQSSAGFDEQLAAGELLCPVCGGNSIAKAPMAPAVSKRAANGPVPDPIRMLRALRREVEARCENVGERFPEEARKIHYGEVEARGIYGDASPGEAKELAEEGIEIAVIPWVPATDA